MRVLPQSPREATRTFLTTGNAARFESLGWRLRSASLRVWSRSGRPVAECSGPPLAPAVARAGTSRCAGSRGGWRQQVDDAALAAGGDPPVPDHGPCCAVRGARAGAGDGFVAGVGQTWTTGREARRPGAEFPGGRRGFAAVGGSPGGWRPLVARSVSAQPVGVSAVGVQRHRRTWAGRAVFAGAVGIWSTRRGARPACFPARGGRQSAAE